MIVSVPPIGLAVIVSTSVAVAATAAAIGSGEPGKPVSAPFREFGQIAEAYVPLEGVERGVVLPWSAVLDDNGTICADDFDQAIELGEAINE